uniref:Uncharacterized protein n=1 Tax=Anguilla anguilla TaxID=7936 RepID=A0A0E9TML8_ANGAN
MTPNLFFSPFTTSGDALNCKQWK